MNKKIYFILLFVFYCAVYSLPAESKMDLQLLKTISSVRARAKSLGKELLESKSITVLAILNDGFALPREDFESLVSVLVLRWDVS